MGKDQGDNKEGSGDSKKRKGGEDKPGAKIQKLGGWHPKMLAMKAAPTDGEVGPRSEALFAALPCTRASGDVMPLSPFHGRCTPGTPRPTLLTPPCRSPSCFSTSTSSLFGPRPGKFSMLQDQTPNPKPRRKG